MHLLPGGGVPRVHRARSPFPPWLSVSPPPGQCINWQPWLRALTHRVAPLMRGRPGRRRCRARATGLSPVGPPWAGAEAALPRGWGVAQCASTALAVAVPGPCVRGARSRFGGLGPVPGVVSLSFPPSRPACPALRVAGCPVRVSLTLARWYAIARGLCVPQARSSCPSGSPRVPFACVCARAPAASAPAPPWVVRRAHLTRSRHWALVGPFHVVHAPPRVLPRSLAPSGVLGGGRSGPGSSLPGLACTPFGACMPRGVVGGCPWGGVACHCCEGRLVSGAVPPPAARPLGLAARVPRPVCPGCGRCGPGDPAPAPQRAPLLVGVARCGGGGRASPGGVPSTVARGI